MAFEILLKSAQPGMALLLGSSLAQHTEILNATSRIYRAYGV